MRVRQRLRAVDDVVSTVESSGVNVAALRRWREEMPTEAEMLPKDKYTTFSKQARDFRKSVHKVRVVILTVKVLKRKGAQSKLTDMHTQVPKWTRLSLRTNPRGF